MEKGGKLEYMAIRKGDTNQTLTEQPTADLFTEKYGFAVGIFQCIDPTVVLTHFKGYGIIRSEYCHALRALIKERGIETRFKMRLQSIEEKDSIVTAHFTNGEKLSADLLIGCDGIHSPTRSYVVGEDLKPDFANASVLVGLSKLTKEDEDSIHLSRGFNMFIGSEVGFGLFPADPSGTWGW